MDFPEKIYFGVILGEGQAEMRSSAFPKPGPEDVVVKMNVCNICTNDYQQFNGLRKKDVPMAAGHEASGTIIWKGERVSPKLEVGMQVANYVNGCNVCYNCRTGNEGWCDGKIHEEQPFSDGYYGRKPGERGFGNYMVIDQRRLVHISNEIAPACAAFLEPFSAALHCLRRGRVMPGEDVVIIGAGTMGMVNAQVAHAMGARVIVTELDPNKIRRAKEMGICDVVDAKKNDPIQAIMQLTGGTGADVVVPCVSITPAFAQSAQMLKKRGGRVVIFGAGYPAPAFPAEFAEPNKVHYAEYEVIGAFGANGSDCVDAARMISNKLVHPEYMLEQKELIPLRDIQKAYELASTPGTYRVSVDLQGI